MLKVGVNLLVPQVNSAASLIKWSCSIDQPNESMRYIQRIEYSIAHNYLQGLTVNHEVIK